MTIGLSSITSGFSGKLRCAYVPGEFSCELPSNTDGYDTSNCNATSSDKLTPSQCNLSCASGYSPIGDFAPSGTCNALPGSQEGTFALKGCYPNEMFSSPASISSCESVTSEGVYLVDLIDSDGNVTEDVKVFCAIDKDGNKSIDVVKTMKLAELDSTESSVGLLFFEANNTSSLVVSAEKNDSNEPGLLVRNLGENIATIPDHRTGFHISKSSQVYNTVSMNYFMQGSRDVNTCNTTSWVPLNGPGFDGGSTSYASPGLSGFTSIQGTAKSGRDASINAFYENQSIGLTEVLTFSGSGTDTNTVYSCMESPHIPRVSGVAKSSTFFTSLLLGDSVTKHCSIPTLPSGMIIDCGSDNDDQLYKEKQCTLSCGFWTISLSRKP